MDSFDFRPKRRPERIYPEVKATKPVRTPRPEPDQAPQSSPPPAPSLLAALKAKGWRGLAAGLSIAAGLIYVIGGIIVFNSGPASGEPKSVPAVFGYIPSSSVVVEGNNGAFTAWRLGLALLVIAILALATVLLIRRFRNKWSILAMALIVVGSGAVVLPQYDRWFAGYNQYVSRYQSLKVYSEKQSELTNQQSKTSEKDLRAQALQQVVIFQYSEQMAKKYGVSVATADIDKSYAEYADKAGGQANLAQQLQDYLGWSPEDYRAELRQQLLQQKLNEKLAEKYKGEADASRQELKSASVRSYVAGLGWDNNLRNIQVR